MDVSAWISPFSSPAGLAEVGGKGANLARLARAGFAVPQGFTITTRAYRDFADANGLDDLIGSALARNGLTGRAPDGPIPVEALECASAEIRMGFRAGMMPPKMAEVILAASREIGQPVAVRSSATAEDLPELSFAGQQDTYLNVEGDRQVLEAVTACWGSLWTARAIGYRLRNRVDSTGMALGVVVQAMVESRASGVMFTANPLTGTRRETVIDAAFGLGEALVSGRVEPDHYVVDTERWEVVGKTLGAKALSIHGQAGGGTREQEQVRGGELALSDAQILELARLGQRAQAEYGFPQDIEWASAGDELFLLQSRPITSLFPVPAGLPADRLMVFFSFAAVQGLLDAITPLGRDALKALFARMSAMFGIRVATETQTVLYDAGERLWVNITTPVRSSLGRIVMPVILPLVEPAAAQALPGLFADPRLQPTGRGISLKAVMQLAQGFLPLVGNVALNIISPRSRREQIVGRTEQLLVRMKSRLAAAQGSPRERLAQTIAAYEEMIAADLLPNFVRFVSLVASGMASFHFMNRLAERLPASSVGPTAESQVLELTRGLPYNPTTEMDLALWQVARAIQGDADLLAAFQAGSGTSLADDYQAGRLPGQGQALIDGFLERYGLRGLAEIDMGRPRWGEQPEHIFDVLTGYIQIDRPELAPDAVFARGAQSADRTGQALMGALRQMPGGFFRARLAAFFIRRMRELMGARESPKFFAVRLMGLIRAPLLRIGADLVERGELAQPDDLVFFTLAELKMLAAGAPNRWKALAAERRAAWERERGRRQVPRLLLSDGRAFYEGIISPASGDGALAGSPVSAGVAEGRARVVLDPSRSGLVPGEILICPGTDPSWTPLFLSAAGLVMEVGGMMTHGAVVAREYGIPAIVGVDQATRRIETGQRIRIDGSTGRIELIPD